MRVLLLAGAALALIAATATANEPVISLEGAATASHWTAAQRTAHAPQLAQLGARLDALAAREAAEHGVISTRLLALHERMRAMHHGHGAVSSNQPGDLAAHHEALLAELGGDKDLAETVAIVHAMLATMEPAQRDEFCAYLHGRITAAGLVTAGPAGER